MRLLYGTFKNVLSKRKEHISWKCKQVNYHPDMYYLAFDTMLPKEDDDYINNLMNSPYYTQYTDKYVDKMWLDESNWKIAYDVWMSKGKEYNKFDIQTYHKALKFVIPYLEKNMENGKRVRCDKVLSEGLDGEGAMFAFNGRHYLYYRVVEFVMATIYDTQKY